MVPEDCHKNPYCSEAANNFQFNLVSNLTELDVERIIALSMFPTASFPRSDNILIGTRVMDLSDRLELISLPFLNVSILKPITQLVAFFLGLLWLVQRQRFRPDAILVYNPLLPYALPALVASWLWRIPAVLVVADLNPPGTWSWRASVGRQLETRLQTQVLKRFSGLIVLSRHVGTDFGGDRAIMKLEGGIDEAQIVANEVNPPANGIRAIMYCGKLDELSGVRLLLDAFALISDSRYQLWITGRGEMEPEVQQAVRQDVRIRYLGFVSRKRLLELMRQATVLVNPRLSSFPENRYNFPSKLLEYLASGRPVITTNVSDLEDEYGDMVILLRRETPEELAKLIQSVCSRDKSELDAMGARARDYVLAHKSWSVQSRKVYDFLVRVAMTSAAMKPA